MTTLNKDDTAEPIQAFPLQQGKIGITTGSHSDIDIIHCIADGSITLTWYDGNTDAVACVAHDDYCVKNAKTVEITSGTFNLA